MPDITRTPESAAEFEAGADGAGRRAATIIPCIVMWVPFNEGWGQFDTARVVELIKKLDPTRLVDDASGWTDRGVGDVMDMHKYPGPGRAGAGGEPGARARRIRRPGPARARATPGRREELGLPQLHRCRRR